MSTFASLEAQAAAIADDIAYDAHDIDDGLRAGILTLQQLEDAPLVGGLLRQVRSAYPKLEKGRVIGEVVRRQITVMVEDVVKETARRLEALEAAQGDGRARRADDAVITFSKAMAESGGGFENLALRASLPAQIDHGQDERR